MDPKKEEWMQFCDAFYPSDPYRHVINADKCYCFMCYQSFRESKKRGGEKALLREFQSGHKGAGVMTSFPVQVVLLVTVYFNHTRQL